MENQNQQKSPLSSLAPMLIMGAVLIVGLQFFGPDEDKKKKQTGTAHLQPGKKTPGKPGKKLPDFSYTDASSSDSSDVIAVDTGAFYAEFTRAGGRVRRFYLKSHGELVIPATVIAASKDEVSKREKALEITRGNGLDFQPHLYYSRDGRYWQIAEPVLNKARFTAGKLETDPVTGTQEIRFTARIRFKGHRLEVIKVFRFFKDEHFFRQTTAIRNLERREFKLASNQDPVFFKTFGDIGSSQEFNSGPTPTNRFINYGDEFQTKALAAGGAAGCAPLGCGGDDITSPVVAGKNDSLRFIGSTSRYFFGYTQFLTSGNSNTPDGLVMVLKIDPKGRETATTFFNGFGLAPAERDELDLGGVKGNVNDQGKIVPQALGNRSRVKATQQKRKDALVIDNLVYFGVRSQEAHSFRNEPLMQAEFGIKEASEKAGKAIFTSSYYAFFNPIKEAIIWLMRKVYAVVGNYGWAIIIIATGLKLATWPLNQMQAKSMKKMTALKPELDKLNEKFADDPQGKQKAMMELYKKHKINPAKSCLPIFIQMPIFIALFNAFSESVELWQSPFILWMTDLSLPDTIFTLPATWAVVGGWNLNILPLLMVASQIGYQKFTTMTTDPQQKMMMYILPVMFIFIFWSMPSGVTLYWTIQNVLSMVWQLASNRFSSDDEPVPAT